MGPASAIAVILVLVGLGLALLLRRLGGGGRPTASWKGPDMATTLTTGTGRGTEPGRPQPRRGAGSLRQLELARRRVRLALARRS